MAGYFTNKLLLMGGTIGTNSFTGSISPTALPINEMAHYFSDR